MGKVLNLNGKNFNFCQICMTQSVAIIFKKKIEALNVRLYHICKCDIKILQIYYNLYNLQGLFKSVAIRKLHFKNIFRFFKSLDFIAEIKSITFFRSECDFCKYVV